MSGPLHGGAPARVLPMLAEVERPGDAGRPGQAACWTASERLMGFGHRVYRAEDPRARVLRRTCQRAEGRRATRSAVALEQAALAELRERRPDRAIETNVEFWAAVILDFAGVPAHMMPAMFTCARTAGWRAHILEQKRLGRLVRPSALYVGPRRGGADEVAGYDSAGSSPADPAGRIGPLDRVPRECRVRAMTTAAATHATSTTPPRAPRADDRFDPADRHLLVCPPSSGPPTAASAAARPRSGPSSWPRWPAPAPR